MMTSEQGQPTQRGQGFPPVFVNTHTIPFYDANGKVRSGVRTIEPPADTRQSIRGHLYCVVALNGGRTDRAQGVAQGNDDRAEQERLEREQIAEQLLGIIQRTYYTGRGAQSVVLKDALLRAHRALIEINRHRTEEALRGGVICAALLKDQLALVGSGPAFALVSTHASAFQFPAHLLDPAQGLGGDSEPEIHFYRERVEAESVVFLGDGAWFEHLTLRKLLGIITHTDVDNCPDVVDYLCQETRHTPLPALLTLLDQPFEDSVQEQNAAHSPLTDREPIEARGGDAGYSSLGSLPTAVGARPPVHTVPHSPSAASSSPKDWPDTDARDSTHLAADAGRGLLPLTSGVRRRRASQVEASPTDLPAEREPGVAEEPSTATSATSGLGQTLMSALRTTTQRVRQWLRPMLPDPRTTHAEVAQRAVTPPEADDTAIKVPQQTPIDRMAALRRRLPESSPAAFRPPEPARGRRARLFILLAVLFLVLVPVIVMATVWQQGVTVKAEANALIDAAGANVLSARRALDGDDKAGARAQLYEALGFLNEANSILPGDQRASELELQIQKELQEVEQARLLYRLVEPLASFPVDAMPHRVLVVDQDVYVLDTGRNLVQHFRLDTSQEALEDPAGDLILQAGQEVEGIAVGPLVDITWQTPIPGVDDKSNLLVLDRNKNVFRYNGIEGATRSTFGDQGAWNQPTQIETYMGRIYVADEGRRQIYRYNPGGYDVPPDPWLAPQTQINLAGLLSMVIEGDIWTLFSNNLILRYNQGEQVPFVLENDAGLLVEPVDLFVGDQSNSALYIADASAERILVFSKDGTYLYQLKAAEGSPLRDLRGIYVDEVAGTIYLLTRSALFQHPLPQ